MNYELINKNVKKMEFNSIELSSIAPIWFRVQVIDTQNKVIVI